MTTSTIVKPDYSGLDNTIKPDPASSTDYTADNGVFQASFKQSGNTVTFTKGTRSVVWSPSRIGYKNQTGQADPVYSVTEVPYDTKANYARINRSYPDVDDWFIVQGNQLKHQVLVQGFMRDPIPFLTGQIDFVVSGSLEFDADLSVRANGLTLTGPFETAGAIDIYDGDQILFTLPQVIAYDSGYERTETTGKYRVTQNENGTLAFDICVDNGWMSSTDRVYPIVIDPTVIANSNYDLSGNGGRKIVRLSNNWLVAIARNAGNTADAYISKDDGATWQGACWFNLDPSAGFAVASNGTTVYTLFAASAGTLNFYKFDATTVPNAQLTPSSNPDTAQTAINGDGVTLAIDGTGTLHAAWLSKNSAYPTSYNVRYSKSTDGGSTWSTPTQVSTTNYNGDDTLQLCLVLTSNNYPHIVYAYDAGGACTIGIYNWNGSAFGSMQTVYAGNGTYAQSFPCAVVDSNDTIHVVWHGYMSPNTSFLNILYSKSTDGGNTWSTPVFITNQNAYDQRNPTIAVDGNNNLYVLWQGVDSATSTSYTQIKRVINTNGTWPSTATLITTNTTGNASNPQLLWSKFNMNSNDAIRYMWQDAQAGAVKYDSYLLNSPPNAPTLTPHGNFNAATAQTLAWTFSDPNAGDSQSAYQLQIVDTSNNNVVKDTGKVASTSSSYSLAANTLTNGKQYQWRVTTWDQSGAQGPWSSYSTFNTASAPSVTITAPTANQVLAGSSVTAGWSYSDPASNAQQSYDVQLLNSTGSTVLWDSGTMTGTNNTQTVGYTLANNTTYQLKVTVTNAQGISATSAAVTFSTSYTTPNQLSLAYSMQTGYYKLTISNPAGGQSVSYNDLYRRVHGTSTWTRIATNIAVNGTYNDYAVASSTQYDYYAVAVGTNTATTSTGTLTTNALSMLGLWVHDPTNPAGTITNIQYQTDFKKDEWKPSATVQQFAGRSKPVVQLGEQESYTLSAQKTAFLTSDANWPAVQALIKTKKVLCWRDGRGRKVYGNVLDMQNQDDSYGNVVDLEITEVDYTEAV